MLVPLLLETQSMHFTVLKTVKSHVFKENDEERYYPLLFVWFLVDQETCTRF